MNFEEYFDELQKTWQRQHASDKLTLSADTDAMLKEVRREQQLWGRIAWHGDALEIGGGFLMGLFFSYVGLRRAGWSPFSVPDWDFLLVALACIGVGMFKLVDRIAQRRKRTAASNPLKTCIQASLNEVDHDIWLQRNVFWWSWLPFTAALAICFGYRSLVFHTPRFLAFLVLFVIPLAWWGNRLSQFTTRKVLEPRRQELQSLLASLNENS